MDEQTQQMWNKWCDDRVIRILDHWQNGDLGKMIKKLLKRDQNIHDQTVDAVKELRRQIDWLHRRVNQLESGDTRSIARFKHHDHRGTNQRDH
jgi:hypothetical protein